MGRFFRHLGIWLAERGTTLGRLEQLIGCQSVFLAVERQICLRKLSIVGICSIVAWLLSPFGGQSALRVLRQEETYLDTTRPLYYLSPQSSMKTSVASTSGANSGRPEYTSLFLAALLSSSGYQTRTADLWGNVKLPSYRAIKNSTSDDWKPIPDHATANVAWASLIGIPVSAFDGKSFTSYSKNHFKIRGRQFDISCLNNSRVDGDWTYTGNVTSRLSTWEITTPAVVCRSFPCPFMSQSVAQQGEGGKFSNSVAFCEYYYDYLEADIECVATSCRATALRKLDSYSDGYTKEWEMYLCNNFMGGLRYMTSVDTIGTSDAYVRGSTVMEKWMYDPSNFIGGHRPKLYELPPSVFAQRLTILWNTFFQSTYAARALAGNLDKATSTNISSVEGEIGSAFNATETFASQQRITYRVNWEWFSVLLSCSLILLAAAYAGLVFKYLSLAPDIVGYASSLTMWNPYVPTAMSGTTLHGLERTALLHDLPVRIGDVRPYCSVGAIALATNDGRVVHLDKQKLYI
jgi:hypothetical protein